MLSLKSHLHTLKISIWLTVTEETTKSWSTLGLSPLTQSYSTWYQRLCLHIRTKTTCLGQISNRRMQMGRKSSKSAELTYRGRASSQLPRNQKKTLYTRLLIVTPWVGEDLQTMNRFCLRPRAQGASRTIFPKRRSSLRSTRSRLDELLESRI